MDAEAVGRGFERLFEDVVGHGDRAREAHVRRRRRIAALGHIGDDGCDDRVAGPSAIRSDSTLTRALCLPSATYGPLCSVPPIGIRIVVLPARMLSRSSVQVMSSSCTAPGAWASTACATVTARAARMARGRHFIADSRRKERNDAAFPRTINELARLVADRRMTLHAAGKEKGFRQDAGLRRRACRSRSARDEPIRGADRGTTRPLLISAHHAGNTATALISTI